RHVGAYRGESTGTAVMRAPESDAVFDRRLNARVLIEAEKTIRSEVRDPGPPHLKGAVRPHRIDRLVLHQEVGVVGEQLLEESRHSRSGDRRDQSVQRQRHGVLTWAIATRGGGCHSVSTKQGEKFGRFATIRVLYQANPEARRSCACEMGIGAVWVG